MAMCWCFGRGCSSEKIGLISFFKNGEFCEPVSWLETYPSKVRNTLKKIGISFFFGSHLVYKLDGNLVTKSREFKNNSSFVLVPCEENFIEGPYGKLPLQSMSSSSQSLNSQKSGSSGTSISSRRLPQTSNSASLMSLEDQQLLARHSYGFLQRDTEEVKKPLKSILVNRSEPTIGSKPMYNKKPVTSVSDRSMRTKPSKTTWNLREDPGLPAFLSTIAVPEYSQKCNSSEDREIDNLIENDKEYPLLSFIDEIGAGDSLIFVNPSRSCSV